MSHWSVHNCDKNVWEKCKPLVSQNNVVVACSIWHVGHGILRWNCVSGDLWDPRSKQRSVMHRRLEHVTVE